MSIKSILLLFIYNKFNKFFFFYSNLYRWIIAQPAASPGGDLNKKRKIFWDKNMDEF